MCIRDSFSRVTAALEHAQLDVRMPVQQTDCFGRGITGRAGDVNARHTNCRARLASSAFTASI